MIYFISDTHFYHANIIKYANRPFKTVEEMHETIIRNWNFRVNNNDIVFHLGDVSFTKKGDTKAIIDQLKGNKILIKSQSHDDKSNQWYRDVGFKEVYEYPIVFQGEYLLSHEPIYLPAVSAFINIHGHVHDRPNRDDAHKNVCVEVTNYFPVTLEEIMKIC